jgi:hypothetical protein
MMYPYAEFLIDFDRKHGHRTHENSRENTRAAVIVESRPLFFLPKVIKNVMYFLGPRWNLHVFTSELSHDYVQASLTGWNVGITKFPRVGRLRVADYNGILISPAFWERFSEDKLLIFQADAILTGSNIEEFIGYDFIGAPCGTFDEKFVANGGLSLRSRRVMLDCVTRHACPSDMPEDVFFTNALREMGASMPDFSTAAAFAVESVYTRHPVGVHGTDKCYHRVETAETIVRGISY